MKAKVIETGEIIEVKEWRGASDVIYSTPDMNRFFQKSDLEFLPDTQEVTIEGYVARDQFDHNNLHLHPEKPYRDGNNINEYEDEGFWDNDKEKYFPLPDDMFPELTWWSEPKKVKLTITPME